MTTIDFLMFMALVALGNLTIVFPYFWGLRERPTHRRLGEPPEQSAARGAYWANVAGLGVPQSADRPTKSLANKANYESS